MKKLIATTAAAAVLVAGAFVASTITTNPASAQTEDTTETERPERGEKPDFGAIFDSVIDDLVEEGTIDAGQADEIKNAVEAKRGEFAEAFGQFRGRDRASQRGALRGLLADGVITQAEVDALPEDHPLRTGESPLSELLEDDGQITRDELEAFREEHSPRAGQQEGQTG